MDSLLELAQDRLDSGILTTSVIYSQLKSQVFFFFLSICSVQDPILDIMREKKSIHQGAYKLGEGTRIIHSKCILKGEEIFKQHCKTITENSAYNGTRPVQLVQITIRFHRRPHFIPYLKTPNLHSGYSSFPNNPNIMQLRITEIIHKTHFLLLYMIVQKIIYKVFNDLNFLEKHS